MNAGCYCCSSLRRCPVESARPARPKRDVAVQVEDADAADDAADAGGGVAVRAVAAKMTTTQTLSEDRRHL